MLLSLLLTKNNFAKISIDNIYQFKEDTMIKKTSVIFILCLTLLFNSISVFAQATNDKKVSLKRKIVHLYRNTIENKPAIR